MMQPTNIPPTGGGTDEPQNVQKQKDTSERQVAPMTDDGRKKPFKEVLDKKLLDKEFKQSIVTSSSDDDDDDEQLSLLDLVAANSATREGKVKPSVTNTGVFFDTESEGDQVIALQNSSGLVKPGAGEKNSVNFSVGDDGKSKNAVAQAATEKELPDTASAVAKTGIVETPNKTVYTGKPLSDGTRAKDSVDVGSVEAKGPSVLPKDKKVDEGAETVVVAPTAQITTEVVVPIEGKKLADDINRSREVLMKLAQAMIEQIQQIKAPDRTDTTITLQYPPLFAGVDVKITEFNTSQKQFNITFSGLEDPTARMLIESSENQQKLQQALIDKGYTVQMITIEQKIPGLNSTQAGDVALKDGGQQDAQAGSATDQDEGMPA